MGYIKKKLSKNSHRQSPNENHLDLEKGDNSQDSFQLFNSTDLSELKMVDYMAHCTENQILSREQSSETVRSSAKYSESIIDSATTTNPNIFSNDSKSTSHSRGFLHALWHNLVGMIKSNETPQITSPNPQASTFIPIIAHGHYHIDNCNSALNQYNSSKDSQQVSNFVQQVELQFSQTKDDAAIHNEQQCPLLRYENDPESRLNTDQLFNQHASLLWRYITDPRFIVTSDLTNKSEYPKAWRFSKKFKGTLLNSCAAMLAQLGSGLIEPLKPNISHELGVSTFWVSFASTMYLIGLAFGPIIFGPLSEIKGRKLPIITGMLMGSIVNLLSGLSQHYGLFIICRFLCGIAASSPIVIASSSISDLWYPKQRATFLAFNSLSIILGPTTAYLVGTGLKKFMTWRSVIWTNALATLIVMLCISLISNESYEPVLLEWKAKKLRKTTGNNLYQAPLESMTFSVQEIIKVYLFRPLKLLTYPTVLIVCVFNGFSFGLYFMVSMYVPKKFQALYGWSPIVSALPPLSVFTGSLLGAICHLFVSSIHRDRVMSEKGQYPPESRLYLPLLLGWIMPVGIIIYGWATQAALFWLVPCFGLMLVGAGFFIILQGSLNYLCDAFPNYTASCIAAAIFIRSAFACALPLLAPIIFSTLDMGWGSTALGLFGFTITLLVFFIYRYGGQIREKTITIN